METYFRGPVAKYGLRRRPSEPENVGSNPTGPATKMPLSAKATRNGLICPLAMAEEKMNELKKRVEVQRKVLGSLAKSLEGDDILKDLRERVEKPCEALRFLADGGGANERFVLSWPETRHMFLQYLEFKRYEPANARDMLSYLNRFV